MRWSIRFACLIAGGALVGDAAAKPAPAPATVTPPRTSARDANCRFGDVCLAANTQCNVGYCSANPPWSPVVAC